MINRIQTQIFLKGFFLGSISEVLTMLMFVQVVSFVFIFVFTVELRLAS